MRKDDEGVKKDPPSHQHQKIQQAEVDPSFFLRQIWTPRNGGDNGHGVHEEKDVEEEYVGDGPVQHNLVVGSGGLLQAQSEKPRDIRAQKLRS